MLVFAHFFHPETLRFSGMHCAIVFTDIGSIIKTIIFMIKCLFCVHLRQIPALITNGRNYTIVLLYG